MVNAIDAVLTVLFWIPAKLIGVEKCSKCTVRVRWFQLLMIVTRPVARVPFVRESRVDWDLRADPQPQGGLRPVTLMEIGQS